MITEQGILFLFAFIIGAAIGSFINVVVYRLPKIMNEEWNEQASHHLGIEYTPPKRKFNLCTPRSGCPNCGSLIKSVNNIPIISFIKLKGKCHSCQAAISQRYPAIELSAGLLAIAGLSVYGINPLGIFVSGALLTLLCLALIDMDTMTLPDVIVYPLLWTGLLVSASDFAYISLHESVLGAAIGYMTLWLVFHIFKLLTKKEGMGHGDFKLLAAIGAWVGPIALTNVMVFASISGIFYLIAMKSFGKIQDVSKPIPFGPFLAFGGISALLF